MSEIVTGRLFYSQRVIPENICEKIIQHTNQHNQFTACQFGGQVDSSRRDCNEVKITDDSIMDVLMSHVKNIPSIYEGRKLVGIDRNRVYLLRYNPGQFFKQHRDGYSMDSQSNRSLLTLQIYLNEGFVGGETRFYSETGIVISGDVGAKHWDAVPSTGSLVIFDHRLLHEGMPITHGTKYSIRFNILYEPPYPEYVTCQFAKAPLPYVAQMRVGKSSHSWDTVLKQGKVFIFSDLTQLPFTRVTPSGDPPSELEDYCPYCYKVFPIFFDYDGCPHCFTAIQSTNDSLRRAILAHGHRV